MKTNAEIKTVVFNNLKTSINYEIDKLIETANYNSKYESNEVPESYFQSVAYTEFSELLLKTVIHLNQQSLFILKTK